MTWSTPKNIKEKVNKPKQQKQNKAAKVSNKKVFLYFCFKSSSPWHMQSHIKTTYGIQIRTINIVLSICGQ